MRLFLFTFSTGPNSVEEIVSAQSCNGTEVVVTVIFEVNDSMLCPLLYVVSYPACTLYWLIIMYD